MLTGQNGILNRAVEAKEKTEIANEEEQRTLAQAEAIMNTEKTIYKGVTLPEGFAPTKIEGENSIDDGLVITDAYGNEYVWIEVPRTQEVYKSVDINLSDISDADYKKIENDLYEYVSLYRNNTQDKDEYSEDNSLGWYSQEEYNKIKKKMLSSIYNNGGFWIGRYETGIEKEYRDYGSDYYTEHPINENPVVKKNAYPYNWVNRKQAAILSRKMKDGDYETSLIFGIQWDLTLKYIEEKNVNKDDEANSRSRIQKKLNADSSGYGNYYNEAFKLNRGLYMSESLASQWFQFDSNVQKDKVTNKNKLAQAKKENAVLLTTGASDSNKIQNIYDIAGNVWEWTLEKPVNNFCSFRGGSYLDKSEDFPASYRYSTGTSYSHRNVGFRIVMY